ncbi:MAG TPA: hypothetical protein VF003_12410 [Pseudonocardiaceae bacterium]
MTAPHQQCLILDADQLDELRRLLGTVEDWLLHASFEVLDDLAAFLAGLSWGGWRTPEQLATDLIADLGEATLTLRPTPNHHRPTTAGTS